MGVSVAIYLGMSLDAAPHPTTVNRVTNAQMTINFFIWLLQTRYFIFHHRVNDTKNWTFLVAKVRYEALVGTTNDIGNTYGANYLINSNEAIFTNTGIKNMYNSHSSQCGAVAHLGERFNGIEEVGSSSPPSSTIVPVVGVSP
jgi:hypothetical protein